MGTPRAPICLLACGEAVDLAETVFQALDTNEDGSITRDELLTNVMLYWVTGTIHASTRWYAAHKRRPPASMRPDTRIEVPTAVADFPAETVRVPRSAAERKYDLRQWTEMPAGGHFAAMEQPALLVEDVRRFFRSIRTAQG